MRSDFASNHVSSASRTITRFSSVVATFPVAISMLFRFNHSFAPAARHAAPGRDVAYRHGPPSEFQRISKYAFVPTRLRRVASLISRGLR